MDSAQGEEWAPQLRIHWHRKISMKEQPVFYADKGLMTADQEIANDVANMFEFFKHTYYHFNYSQIIISPFSMRKFFVHKIDQEITNARKGKTGLYDTEDEQPDRSRND